MVASVAQQLFEMAEDIVRGLEARRSALEAELLKVKARRVEIEGELNATNLARKRLADFPVTDGLDLLCPICWVREGQQSALKPMPSDTKDEPHGCPTCGAEVLIEMGF